MIAHSVRFRKKPSLIFPTFFIIIVFLLIVFLAVSNWNLNKKRSHLNAKIDIMAQKNATLERINSDLKEKISEIPEENYLEKVAREQFNLKKPGEEVVVIKKERGSATSAESEPQKSFFEPKKWLEWVKSKFGI